MPIDPIHPDLKKTMNKVAHTLGELFNPKQFVLLVFDTSDVPRDQRRVNYIGSTNRKQMVPAIREFLAKTEGEDPLVQVGQTLGLVVPDDTPPGTKMAIQFTWDPTGIRQMELLEWNEEENEVRD